MPLMPSIPLLVTEYLEFLLVPQYTPDTPTLMPPNGPYTPRSLQMPPIPLLVPEYLEFLLAPQYTPDTPQTTPYTP